MTIRERITPYSIVIFLIGLLLVTLFVQQFFFTKDHKVDESVKVGVVDSGCSATQSNHVLEYKSFTTMDYGFTYDDKALYDSIGHGTQVCDLIIDQAPNVALISAKIAIVNQITYQAVLAAIEWLIIEHAVDIINLSLGSNSFISEKLSDVFEKYQNSTLFVVSSGNQGSSNFFDEGYVDWPSIYPWVVGVGASNPSDNSILAGYSSYGIGYYGTYVNQFIENGGTGTSFSTPKIVGKLANLLFQLQKERIEVTDGELLALFIAHNDNGFNEKIGWGYPSNPVLNKSLIDSTYFYIHGNTTYDPHLRYSTEKWERHWKFSSYGLTDADFSNYQIQGNGSSVVNDVKIIKTQWGGMLSITFDPINHDTSNYEIEFNIANSNNITYQFSLSNQSQGKILFDHRLSINGYGHPYGEFSLFEQFLRESGYIVHHTPYQSVTNLTEYNLTIVPSIGQLESLSQFTISAKYDGNLITEYETYVDNGGKALFMGHHPEFLNFTTTSMIGETFGVSQTEIEFGDYNLGDKSAGSYYIQNITDHSIGDGVVNFKYQGSEVVNLTSGLEAIAWGNVVINSEVNTKSVGMYGQKGNGHFIYVGGTSLISNIFFDVAYGINFDRFVTNLLELN